MTKAIAVEVPKEDFRGYLKITRNDWLNLARVAEEYVDDIRRQLEDAGYIDEDVLHLYDEGHFAIEKVNAVNPKILEQKIDLILDHLGLEFEPEHKCGPNLKPKEEDTND